MGIVRIMSRGGEELREYKRALKMAKKGIETICDLSEDMEEEFGERYGERYDGRYSRRDDEDWGERRHYRY